MEEKVQEEFKKNQTVQKNEYYTNRPELDTKGTSKLRQYFANGMSLFIVLVSAIILYFLLLRVNAISDMIGVLINVSKPVIYGLAIAYLLNPVMKFVERYVMIFLEKAVPGYKKKKTFSRAVAIFAAIVFLLAVIVALINMIIPELVRSIRSMIITLPPQLNEAIDQITAIISDDTALGIALTNILTEGISYLENWMKTDLLAQVNIVMTSVTEGVINFFTEFFNMLIGIFAAIYLLFSKETFSRQCKKVIYAIWKPSSANMILHLTSKSNDFFGGFIIGKIIDSAIIGVLCFIGLSILDMPYTLLVSVVVGVTNVIPFFGPYIGAIPCALLILLSDPKMGLYFIIFIFLLQQLDGNVIGPKILGNSTGLSTFWVMSAILVSGGLFGVIGMILGVPAFAVIYYIVKMLIEHNLEKKHLPLETKYYDELSYVTSEGEYVHSEKTENNIQEEKGDL